MEDNNSQKVLTDSLETAVKHSDNAVTAVDLVVELEAIAEGRIPDSLDILTAIGRRIVRAAKLTPAAMAVIVAKSRAQMPVADWVEWSEKEFGYCGSYLHHLNAIGKMLLYMNNEERMKTYRKLFVTSFDKLQILTQISFAEIESFLSHNNVETMTRDEVRAAVAKWLGKEVKPNEPVLPGFDEMLDSIQRSRATLLQQVADPVTAYKSISAGLDLMGAGLEFHKHTKKPDVETLIKVKTGLLNEVKEIEDAIARAAQN